MDWNQVYSNWSNDDNRSQCHKRILELKNDFVLNKALWLDVASQVNRFKQSELKLVTWPAASNQSTLFRSRIIIIQWNSFMRLAPGYQTMKKIIRLS